jgi:hypothetical protein
MDKTRPVTDGDQAFRDWLMKAVGEPKTAKKYLCPGASITLDADGRGTFEQDPKLPDGEWVVKHHDGRVFRLHGVYGPVSLEVESVDGIEMESANGVEVSYPAVEFEEVDL